MLIWTPSRCGTRWSCPCARASTSAKSGDTLAVPKMTRLARNVEDTLHMARDLTGRGAIFQMGHTVYDPRDPWSKLFLSFLAAIAEAEGESISLRTQGRMESGR
ncbi:recombinase family protein [Microbacterium sp. PM5]|uniref:recombinase family protein n=1 Tax=Microbacterium sp. PM5 TaxID=2014534 RepID=UPI0023B7EDE0|nr:recombinase family protein [Microbacterium sp. PM5]MDC7805205.1 recombinase family protein [Sphingomonas sp. BLCC-B65]